MSIQNTTSQKKDYDFMEDNGDPTYVDKIQKRFKQIIPGITSDKYNKEEDDKKVNELLKDYIPPGSKGGFTRRKRARGKSYSKRAKKHSKRSRQSKNRRYKSKRTKK